MHSYGGAARAGANGRQRSVVKQQALQQEYDVNRITEFNGVSEINDEIDMKNDNTSNGSNCVHTLNSHKGTNGVNRVHKTHVTNGVHVIEPSTRSRINDSNGNDGTEMSTISTSIPDHTESKGVKNKDCRKGTYIPTNQKTRTKLFHLLECGLLAENTEVLYKDCRAKISEKGTIVPLYLQEGDQNVSAEFVEWLSDEYDSPSAFAAAVSTGGRPDKKVSANGWSSIKIQREQDNTWVPLDDYRQEYEKLIGRGWDRSQGSFGLNEITTDTVERAGRVSKRKNSILLTSSKSNRRNTSSTSKTFRKGEEPRRTVRTLSLDSAIDQIQNDTHVPTDNDFSSHRLYTQKFKPTRRNSSPAETSRHEKSRQQRRLRKEQEPHSPGAQPFLYNKKKKLELASLEQNEAPNIKNMASSRIDIPVLPFVIHHTIPVTLSKNSALLNCDMCFACGGIADSEDLETSKMIYCIQCGEAYHSFCVASKKDNESRHQAPENWDQWECPKCTICIKCFKSIAEISSASEYTSKQSNTILKCAQCEVSVHLACQKVNDRYVEQSMEEAKGQWLCENCAFCVECASNPTIRMTNMAEREVYVNIDDQYASDCDSETHESQCNRAKGPWTQCYRLCPACSQFRAKGNICPICRKLYDDDDYDTPMVQCDKCSEWIHQACDSSISKEMYEAMDDNESLPYDCPVCRVETKTRRGNGKRTREARISCHTEATHITQTFHSGELNKDIPYNINEAVTSMDEVIHEGSSQIQESIDTEAALALLSISIFEPSAGQSYVAVDSKSDPMEIDEPNHKVNPDKVVVDSPVQEHLSNFERVPIFSQSSEKIKIEANVSDPEVRSLTLNNSHESSPKSNLYSRPQQASTERTCVLCHSTDNSDLPGSSGRLVPLWMEFAPSMESQIWVHVLCLLFSKGISLDPVDGGLKGVQKVIRESNQKTCVRCRLPGASLECEARSGSPQSCAGQILHFPCANSQNSRFVLDTRTMVLHCEEHSTKKFRENFQRLYCSNASLRRMYVKSETDIFSEDDPDQSEHVWNGPKVYSCLPSEKSIRYGALIIHSLGKFPDNGTSVVDISLDYPIPIGFHFERRLISASTNRKLKFICQMTAIDGTVFSLEARKRKFEDNVCNENQVVIQYDSPQSTRYGWKVVVQEEIRDPDIGKNNNYELIEYTEQMSIKDVVEWISEKFMSKGESNFISNGNFYLLRPASFFGLNYPSLMRMIKSLPNYKETLGAMQRLQKIREAEFENMDLDAEAEFTSARTEARSKCTVRKIRRIGSCCHITIVEKSNADYDVIAEHQDLGVPHWSCGNLHRSSSNDVTLALQYAKMKEKQNVSLRPTWGSRETEKTINEKNVSRVTRRRGSIGTVPAVPENPPSPTRMTAAKPNHPKVPPTDVGVFATRSFEKDEMIMEYTGIVLSSVVARRLESAYALRKKMRYMMWGDVDWVIDASKIGGLARYVREDRFHANVYARPFIIHSKRKIAFFALRKINPNEEITFHYGIEKDVSHTINE